MKDMSNGAKINRWGRKYIFGETKAKAFVVNHKSANGKLTEVQKFELEEETGESLWKSIIEEMVACLQDNTEGTGGTQTFVLHAVADEEKIVSRLIVRQRSEEDEDDDSLTSEPATSKGLLSMFMRHLDAMHRNQTIAYANIMRASQSQLDALGTMAEKMGEKTIALISAHEQALSQQNERDLASAEKQAEIENKQEMMKRFMMLLPTIAKRFGLEMESSQGDLPPEVIQFRDFLGNLSEDEYGAITRNLPPDKMVVLNDFMQKNAAREEQENPGRKLPLSLIPRPKE